MRARWPWRITCCVLFVVLPACSGTPAAPTATPRPTATATTTPPQLAAQAPTNTPPPPDPVLVGAGDIAGCDGTGDEATALLLDGIAGTVFTVGDNAYPDGSAADFANCYEPSWGRHKARTRPAPGNHEYHAAGAEPYYSYFGAAAGEPGKGYYSYDLGAWHLIALNSNCAAIGGCHAGSAQEQWLRADLAAHPATCTLAYWHHARFSSSSKHGSDQRTQGLWRALYDAGADVVLTGHDHDYERFAPQDAAGRADPARGIRQFVVGTGGAGLYSVENLQPNSEAHNADTHGVLKLTLRPTGYEWQFIPVTGYPVVGDDGERRFVPVEGEKFTDAGSGACHGRRMASPGQTLTFTPVADAYVDSAAPRRNFGAETYLIVDADSVREAYLRFELSGLSGAVTSATLLVYVPTDQRNAGSGSGGSVARMSDTAWSEATVTYATRPAIDGPVVAMSGPVAAGQWYEFDVTRAVSGDGVVSLGLRSGTDDAAYYASRESGSFAPQLIVTITPN